MHVDCLVQAFQLTNKCIWILAVIYEVPVAQPPLPHRLCLIFNEILMIGIVWIFCRQSTETWNQRTYWSHGRDKSSCVTLVSHGYWVSACTLTWFLVTFLLMNLASHLSLILILGEKSDLKFLCCPDLLHTGTHVHSFTPPSSKVTHLIQFCLFHSFEKLCSHPLLLLKIRMFCWYSSQDRSF